MLKSFAVISAVIVAVYAQSNPLIPSNVSDGCSKFLNGLNANAQVSTCTSALNVALDGFAPGKPATATAAEIASALENVCGSDACPSTLITQQVTAFYSACTAELTSSPVDEVVRLYDILYVINPMKGAICSKDDTNKWCVMASNNLGGASASDLQSSLYTQDGQTVIPNTKSFSENNLPFLLLKPSLDKDALCKPCTRNVLRSYIDHESAVPYAPGLAKSQLLQSQSALFTAVTEKCSSDFMDQQQVKAAGGIGNNLLPTGAAAPSTNAALSGLMAIAVGFVTLAVQAL
ncbi:hypothetical protein BKA70DRAFT_1145337 [Coprinopsis sp. MPI-PUGE-AT-0042]|nr:hypothetical protein BKA70DRAFT_1145337 [Coprinopsis sp. MPI-PUGE-AT-0042]